jgi:hypothetical protein
MASSQAFESGFLKLALRPPQTVSLSGMGVRIEAGQLASSHARVSCRKVSMSVMMPPLTLMCRLSWALHFN